MFLDRSAISLAATSGANTTGKMLDSVTPSMMIGEATRPARVAGTQSSSQKVPYSAMN